MIKNDYIRKFAEKHSFVFKKFADPDQEIAIFEGGIFFDILDIVSDIDENLPAWAAKDFHREGTDGIVKQTYIEWYGSRQKEINERVHSNQ